MTASAGWSPTKGFWKTNEAGKTGGSCRNRRHRSAGLLRDEKNGWAACKKKKVLRDARWRPQMGTRSSGSRAARERRIARAYTWIAFANPNYGSLSGSISRATRWGSRVSGLDGPGGCDEPPRDAAPLYTMVTLDGGQDLEAGSTSLFGQVTRVRFSAERPGPRAGRVRRLVPLSGEVYKFDWRPGRARRSSATSASPLPILA